MIKNMKPAKRKINILFGLDALVDRKPIEEMNLRERRDIPLPRKYRLMFFGGRT